MENTSLHRIKMISVVVPVYNAEKFIGECIESILRQTFFDWELILVDDGSTDKSGDIIAGYLSDKRIKYVRKENTGVTETRWIGVEKSRGEIVVFLDADDIFAPEALELISDNFDDGTDVVAFGRQCIMNSNELLPVQKNSKMCFLPTDNVKLCDNIMTGKIFSTVTGIGYHRSLIINHRHLFCNGLQIGEDTLFNLLLSSEVSLKGKILSERPYGYRINEESVTRTVTQKRFDAIKDTLDYIDRYVDEHPTLSQKIEGAIAFRKLLLWATFMFHPSNKYYRNQQMRNKMRSLYPKAFSRLYPYLRIYLFIDLYIGPWLSQRLIKKK